MAPSLVPGEEELGPQRRCPRCGCWWPQDEEFFVWTRIKGRPGWHAWCRACLAEAAVLRRARQRGATGRHDDGRRPGLKPNARSLRAARGA